MHAGFLSEYFARIICADIINYSTLYNGDFCRLIKEKHEAHGIVFHSERIDFSRTDAMNLIFRDNLFDCCLSFNAFEHIPDPALALSEIIRTLKPGGYAYIAFDPLWTADTGSHFFHAVPEPWAHLLLKDPDYTLKMVRGGATESDCAEYLVAMNRWRLGQFREIFDSLGSQVLFHDSYQGVALPIHSDSPNFFLAKAKGYSQEELLTRRLRWVVRKSV